MAVLTAWLLSIAARMPSDFASLSNASRASLSVFGDLEACYAAEAMTAESDTE